MRVTVDGIQFTRKIANGGQTFAGVVPLQLLPLELPDRARPGDGWLVERVAVFAQLSAAPPAGAVCALVVRARAADPTGLVFRDVEVGSVYAGAVGGAVMWSFDGRLLVPAGHTIQAIISVPAGTAVGDWAVTMNAQVLESEAHR